jgi:hypothetical protein
LDFSPTKASVKHCSKLATQFIIIDISPWPPPANERPGFHRGVSKKDPVNCLGRDNSGFIIRANEEERKKKA